MDILFLLIPLSVVLAFCIGWFFWRAVDTGQFDDLDTPGLAILADDDKPRLAENNPPAESKPRQNATPKSAGDPP